MATEKLPIFMLNYRQAVPSDLHRLYKIEKKCKGCRYDWTEDEFKEAFLQDNVDILLVEWSPPDHRIGIFGFVATEVLNKKVYVSLIDVHPNYQGWGYGRELLLKAEDKFRDLGFPKIVLHTHVQNKSALPMYIKMDYAPVRVVNDYYRKEEHALYMEKKLCRKC